MLKLAFFFLHLVFQQNRNCKNRFRQSQNIYADPHAILDPKGSPSLRVQQMDQSLLTDLSRNPFESVMNSAET